MSDGSYREGYVLTSRFIRLNAKSLAMLSLSSLPYTFHSSHSSRLLTTLLITDDEADPEREEGKT
jgi:hypothetical protein